MMVDDVFMNEIIDSMGDGFDEHMQGDKPCMFCGETCPDCTCLMED